MRAEWLWPLLLAGAAAAAEPPGPETGGAVEPDPELLEFLGGFTLEDGSWIDPSDLDPDLVPQPGHPSQRAVHP